MLFLLSCQSGDSDTWPLASGKTFLFCFQLTFRRWVEYVEYSPGTSWCLKPTRSLTYLVVMLQ